MRADLRAIPQAVKLGWVIILDRRDNIFQINNPEYIPQYPLTFVKGNKTICLVKTGWMCADIKDDILINHRLYKSLPVALETESN